MIFNETTMFKKLKKNSHLYICIILSIVAPSAGIKFLKLQKNNEERKHTLASIDDFRKTYSEAAFATIACIIFGYLLAGLPIQISWNKLIPTILIAFPVYGTRFAKITWGGNSIGEQMDKLFFKTLYIIGLTWLIWDIFKGII